MTDDDRRLDNTDDERETMKHEDKLAELNRITEEQDAAHEAKIAEITGDKSAIDETDADRLLVLDRIAERMPDLDLEQHRLDWKQLPDGLEALVVDGGGFDGHCGYFIANSPAENDDDLHVVGPTEPLFPGKIAAVAIHADGTRELVRLIPDPLADWRVDE